MLGYAAATGTGLRHQFLTLPTSSRELLMATTALGLLLFAGAICAPVVRRRLRYETWHFLHWYVYLAIVLAFTHQLAYGADLRQAPAIGVGWTAMYVVVAVLLLRYRFLQPVLLALRHRFVVSRVVAAASGVVSVHITGRALDRLPAEPGQYFRWRFLTRGLWWTANPYSLSQPPSADDGLRITVKAVGDQSRALRELRPGTRVVAEGPCGHFTARHTGDERAGAPARKVLLIAGGIGITPLRALFEALPCPPGELTLIYRAGAPEDVVFADELDHLATVRGHRVVYLIGRRDATPGALTEGTLRDLFPDLSTHDIYLCGPPGMVASVRRALRRAGADRRRIVTESFRFSWR
jgi:ferredoxin-NADP reductase